MLSDLDLKAKQCLRLIVHSNFRRFLKFTSKEVEFQPFGDLHPD